MNTPSFSQSEAMLARALRTIPLGSQTFSKSKTHYPFGVSPYFMARAKGSHTWDVDGNEYVDFVNCLTAVTLGYCDPDVDGAVRAQLESGVAFSLPHPLEMQVAEELSKLVPSAEMVRFGKNGSDATAGAIRLARAYTRRDHVAVCGYHGWQDWYIGSTARNAGVPVVTQQLTHTFRYNDSASLEELLRKFPGQFAAVILEPMNVEFPRQGFLEEVKALTHRHGAVLVFDETITGFRYHIGGAQALFGVTPDLSTFGKGLANGYALSAVGGRRDIMKLMEEIFFSFTFGGEALSLAAALATLQKLQREPVIETITATGEKVGAIVRAALSTYGLEKHFTFSGHPSWSFLNFRDVGSLTSWELKTLYLQEMFAQGILTLGSHNVSYAHNATDLAQLDHAYQCTFAKLAQVIGGRPLRDLLHCEPLQPLFKLR